MIKKNILIVESKNDKYFFEALLKKVLQESIEETEVYRIDYFDFASVSKKDITDAIGSALTSSTKGLSKLGIILDMDDENKESRIELINECFKSAFFNQFDTQPDNIITDINSLVEVKIDEYISIQIACFFTNVGGSGELETILKSIKKEDSVFADGLTDVWQPYLVEKGKILAKRGETGDFTEKEMLKLWVDFYKRFDTLKKKDRNKKNTDWEGIWTGKLNTDNEHLKVEELKASIRGPEIFDLDSELLSDFKKFLRLFD